MKIIAYEAPKNISMKMIILKKGTKIIATKSCSDLISSSRYMNKTIIVGRSVIPESSIERSKAKYPEAVFALSLFGAFVVPSCTPLFINQDCSFCPGTIVRRETPDPIPTSICEKRFPPYVLRIPGRRGSTAWTLKTL